MTYETTTDWDQIVVTGTTNILDINQGPFLFFLLLLAVAFVAVMVIGFIARWFEYFDVPRARGR